MRQAFIKQSIGYNPLLGKRDWLLFGLYIVGVIGASLLLSQFVSSAGARGALIGALAGGVPSLIACRPVRGTVAAERSASFLGRVAQFGYAPAGDSAEGRIYHYKGRRALRWDSSRVVIRTAADGTLHVTAPYSFYFRLKRLQA